jgi:hypothetical protein
MTSLRPSQVETLKRVDRSELYATATGSLLHLTPTCCLGANGHRKLVEDHSYPSHFELPEFSLCPTARCHFLNTGKQVLGEGRDG